MSSYGRSQGIANAIASNLMLSLHSAASRELRDQLHPHPTSSQPRSHLRLRSHSHLPFYKSQRDFQPQPTIGPSAALWWVLISKIPSNRNAVLAPRKNFVPFKSPKNPVVEP